MRTAQSKIVSQEALGTLAQAWHSENKQIVLTNGCFDLLHVGHLRYLERARQMGDLLVVGVNSDESVRALKGAERPILPEGARAELVAGLECVDYVVVFSEPNAVRLVETVRPHYYVKGGDYTEADLPEAEVVIKDEGFVVILPLEGGYSTTQIIQRIRQTERRTVEGG